MPLSILRPLFVPRCLSAPWVVTVGSRIVLLTLSSSAHCHLHRRCRCSGRCACRAASAVACPLRIITVDSCIVLLILNGMVLAIADDAVEAPAVLCVALLFSCLSTPSLDSVGSCSSTWRAHSHRRRRC